jgi:hypothetical protein
MGRLRYASTPPFLPSADLRKAAPAAAEAALGLMGGGARWVAELPEPSEWTTRGRVN